MGELVPAREAALRLRVNVNTLYAYVSRGALRRVPGPDGKTSLYDADEIDALASRSRPRTKRRAPASIDLLVATEISTVTNGVVRYRGMDLSELIDDHLPFETVAELLWQTPATQVGKGWTTECASRGRRRSPAPHIDESTTIPRLIEVITRRQLDSDSAPLSNFGDRDECVDWTDAGRRAIEAMLTVEGVTSDSGSGSAGSGNAGSGSAGSGRVSTRFGVATRLWHLWSPLKATPARVRAMNTALVLLAEHGLALSALAVRVAASARARPDTCLIAGLAALDGALHGRASAAVHREFVESGRSRADEPSPSLGVGHVVHRNDPRTAMLLDAVSAIATAGDRQLIEAVATEAGGSANIDLALAALAYVGRMPVGASTAVFAIARTAGWIAHAQEEYDEQPLRFRGQAIHRTANASTQRPG